MFLSRTVFRATDIFSLLFTLQSHRPLSSFSVVPVSQTAAESVSIQFAEHLKRFVASVQHFPLSEVVCSLHLTVISFFLSFLCFSFCGLLFFYLLLQKEDFLVAWTSLTLWLNIFACTIPRRVSFFFLLNVIKPIIPWSGWKVDSDWPLGVR